MAQMVHSSNNVNGMVSECGHSNDECNDSALRPQTDFSGNIIRCLFSIGIDNIYWLDLSMPGDTTKIF